MALLNRTSEFDHLYDAEGRLQGGLPALEDLARVIAMGVNNGEKDGMETDNEELEPAEELPVSAGVSSSSLSDSDDDGICDDEPNSSDDDVMEAIAMHDEAVSSPLSPFETDRIEQRFSLNGPSPSSDARDILSHVTLDERETLDGSAQFVTPVYVSRRRSSSSRRSLKQSKTSLQSGQLARGDILKRQFIDNNVLPTLLVRALYFVSTRP